MITSHWRCDKDCAAWNWRCSKTACCVWIRQPIPQFVPIHNIKTELFAPMMASCNAIWRRREFDQTLDINLLSVNSALLMWHVRSQAKAKLIRYSRHFHIKRHSHPSLLRCTMTNRIPRIGSIEFFSLSLKRKENESFEHTLWRLDKGLRRLKGTELVFCNKCSQSVSHLDALVLHAGWTVAPLWRAARRIHHDWRLQRIKTTILLCSEKYRYARLSNTVLVHVYFTFHDCVGDNNNNYNIISYIYFNFTLFISTFASCLWNKTEMQRNDVKRWFIIVE